MVFAPRSPLHQPTTILNEKAQFEKENLLNRKVPN